MGGGEMEATVNALGCFVLACCEGTLLIDEQSLEVFDEVATSVGALVVG